MNRWIKFVFVLAASMAIVGCGTFGTKQSGRKAKQNSSELAGTWKLGCSSFGFLGITGQKDLFIFSVVGDFDRSLYIFEDSECKAEVGRFDSKGTYAVIGHAEDMSDGTQDLNFTIRNFTLTVATDDFAKALNASNFCGVTDWNVNQTVNLINRECSVGNV
jgi:hypothetical protein